MKSTLRNALMLAVVLALVGAPSAWAACTQDSQYVRHGGVGSTLYSNCPDDNPIAGFIYGLASPATVNSNGQQFVCRDESLTFPDTFLPCNLVPECGVAGDGNVTVYYEFGLGTGSLGCPNPTASVTGSNPVAVQVVCNNGASVLQQVGFSEDYGGYILDFAGPADGTAISAGFESGPSVTSVGAGPSPSTDNVCVNVPHPRVYSDCEPTSAGFGYSCLDPGTRAPVTRGQLYIRESPCGSSPDPRRAQGGWVLAAVQPDVDGNACNSVVNPTTPGMCTFVGATALLGTTETLAVVGSFQVAGVTASNDKVKVDNAGFVQGKLIVGFSTTNETSIVGFNVYSGATKLNGNLITAKGAGSNAYSFEIGRGALKGGKSVLVEAVKSNGTVEKTAPVTLK